MKMPTNITNFQVTFHTYPTELQKAYLSQIPFINVVAIKDDQNFYGSGFIVEQGYILTANHVVSNIAGTFYAKFHDPDSRFILTNKALIGDDIAGFSIPKYNARPGFKISSPSVGDEIVVCGFPEDGGGFTLSVSQGLVLSINGSAITHNASTLPGQSGGAIVLKSNPSVLIGIHLGSANEQNTNYGASVTELIHRFAVQP